MDTKFNLVKVEFEEITERQPIKRQPVVTIRKGRLSMNSSAVRAMGWTEGMRVDLYQDGNMFALQPSDTGLFLLRRPNNSGKTLIIHSVQLTRHIRVTTHGDCQMSAVPNGKRLLFFHMLHYVTDSSLYFFSF